MKWKCNSQAGRTSAPYTAADEVDSGTSETPPGSVFAKDVDNMGRIWEKALKITGWEKNASMRNLELNLFSLFKGRLRSNVITV